MNKNGIIFSAYGQEARNEALACIESIRRAIQNYKLDIGIAVSSDDIAAFRLYADFFEEKYDSPFGRLAKLSADRWTPFQNTLYLDADTRVNGDISPIFQMLETGFEFVATLSPQQGKNWLWHIDKTERLATESAIGYLPIQLQGGVWGFRKTNNTRKFFANWRKAWKKYPDNYPDQAALTWAIHHSPMKIGLLGHTYNGGAAIAHRFGAARRTDIAQDIR